MFGCVSVFELDFRRKTSIFEGCYGAHPFFQIFFSGRDITISKSEQKQKGGTEINFLIPPCQLIF
jgi:hypothetical protein